MKTRTKRRALQVIVQNGEPSAVILGIEEYRALLEKIEDAEDLKTLDQMRKRPLKFKKLEDFLTEYSPVV